MQGEKRGEIELTTPYFIIGKRNDWKQEDKLIQEEEDGIISTDLVINKETIKVISVYEEQGGKN